MMKGRISIYCKTIPFIFLLGLLLVSCKKNKNTATGHVNMITQPGPPVSGYGSTVYTYTSVTKLNYNDGITGFMLFYPAAPHADSLPVVIFNHGFAEWNPINYGAWINHIILRGNIVIFPIYQVSLTSPVSAAGYTNNVVAAYKRAIDTLQAHKSWPQPRTSKLFIVGHSYGAVIAANMAANYSGYNLPKPLGIMPVAPGTGNPADVPPSNLDPSIYMLPVIEEDDTVVGSTYGLGLFNAAVNVPFSHRNLILQYHDVHGAPGISAVHGECWGVDSTYDNGVTNSTIDFANSSSSVNAADYYCFWKLFDALQDCALNGNGCTTAFGNTSAQKYMGVWSDGTPIVPLGISYQ